jgi:hypothetical protein
VDDYLWIPTEKGAYGLVESMHTLLCHLLTDCLMKDLVLEESSKDDGSYEARGADARGWAAKP